MYLQFVGVSEGTNRRAGVASERRVVRAESQEIIALING
jgi:hypothetical protein